jgi:hypothetical protein
MPPKNIIRNKVRSIVLVLCLIAVLFPFVSAISISEGIKFQSLISVDEGADIYVTGDYFGSNAPISLDYLDRFKKMEEVIGMGYGKLIEIPFTLKEGKRFYPSNPERIGEPNSHYKWQMMIENIPDYPNQFPNPYRDLGPYPS